MNTPDLEFPPVNRPVNVMFKILFRHFMESNWLMKLVVLGAWVSALIMVLALFSPYYQAILEAASVS